MAKPEGVKIVRTDGTELDCELVNRGVDAEGLDVWEVTGVTVRHGDRLQVAVMPPRTSIVMDAKP